MARDDVEVVTIDVAYVALGRVDPEMMRVTPATARRMYWAIGAMSGLSGGRTQAVFGIGVRPAGKS